MLKKWIDEIRKEPDLYKTDWWKYQISGNVIELSVLPVYMKNKSSYRCAVIAVGQVLKALSAKIEGNHFNFHIQTFPSLENPGVVATLRMDSTSTNSRHSSNSISKNLHPKKTKTSIAGLARQYQLDIQKVKSLSSVPFEEIDTENFKNWFMIFSQFNNPFTWLNIGYWKETLQSDYEKHLPADDFTIIDFCSVSDSNQPDSELSKNRYLQSVIGINEPKLAAG